MATMNVSPDVVFNDISSFKWNNYELEQLLHSSSGPVFKDLIRRGILVEASAKQHASGRPGPNVRTGRLRASITWRAGQDPMSPFVDVGTNVEYAPFLEYGTQYIPRYPFLAPALQAARANV